MDKDYLKGLIEEILYVWGDPIDLIDLNDIIKEANLRDIKAALYEIKNERENRPSGLILKEFDGAFQLVTRPIHDKYFVSLSQKAPKKLTTSALETLSIIAYKQPITRAEIDKIRGVGSQTTIDNLLQKGLIKENGRLDKIGKPIIYVTTTYFLQYFDIGSLEELPALTEDSEDLNED